MPKHERLPTSEQTQAALEGIIKPLADELDVSPQYLHAVLGGEIGKPDHYANFKRLFRAVLRIDPARSRIWLSDLQAMQDKAEHKESLSGGVVADKVGMIGMLVSILEGEPKEPERVEQEIAELVKRLHVYKHKTRQEHGEVETWDEYGPSRTGSRTLRMAQGGREIP